MPRQTFAILGRNDRVIKSDNYDSLQIVNSPKQLDSFGRLRVSSPLTQFEYQNEYNSGDLLWNTKSVGTASQSHSPFTASNILTTGGTADGARTIRQTKQYLRYTPGKSMNLIATFCFRAPVTNVVKRVGYFDDENGVFYEEAGGVLSFVVRSNASGSVVDNRVTQDNWNVDHLDGSGISRKTLDSTKTQILEIDLQWLGVGSVRVGFGIDGDTCLAHQFDHANNLPHVYMRTANLPIRYEIFNDGLAAGVGSLDQICSTLITEQGTYNGGDLYDGTAFSGLPEKVITARTPIVSIRPKLTYNSLTNRSQIKLSSVDLLVSTASIYWELVYSGTLTTPSWVSTGTSTTVDYDTTSASIAGGEVLASGLVPAGRTTVTGQQTSLIGRYPITLDIDGLVGETLTLVATPVGATSDVWATMNFTMLY